MAIAVAYVGDPFAESGTVGEDVFGSHDLVANIVRSVRGAAEDDRGVEDALSRYGAGPQAGGFVDSAAGVL